MVNGIVKWFNSRKGYGFIITDKEEDVFVHFTGILDDENSFRTLYEGDKVDFDVKKYSLATLIGSFPRAFFYSFLGYSLGIRPPIKFDDLPLGKINAQSEFFNIVLLIILGILMIMFLTYYLFARYYEKNTINELQTNQ